ncbi:MAG: recombination protein RecR [Bacteroidetes bacterium]|nr:recombination protein RecR [Bacteroidota bacterium]
MNFSSKHIENAVLEISKMPGIGKKSALRMVLFILKEQPSYAKNLSKVLKTLREETIYCQDCYNIADSPICSICSNVNRNNSIICIVENIQDVLAVENTNRYNGLYHVLGGVISPMAGIGPEELNIDALLNRMSKIEVKEIIFALSTTIEGDTTAFYIKKKIKNKEIKISIISRGVSIGGEIEYADEATLAKSILSRVPYNIE